MDINEHIPEQTNKRPGQQPSQLVLYSILDVFFWLHNVAAISQLWLSFGSISCFFLLLYSSPPPPPQIGSHWVVQSGLELSVFQQLDYRFTPDACHVSCGMAQNRTSKPTNTADDIVSLSPVFPLRARLLQIFKVIFCCSTITLVSSPKFYVKPKRSKELNSETQTLNWR